MGGATGLLVAAIVIGCLAYTKPNFFWNNDRMRRARQGLSDADADRITYPFLLGLGVLAVVLMLLG